MKRELRLLRRALLLRQDRLQAHPHPHPGNIRDSGKSVAPTSFGALVAKAALRLHQQTRRTQAPRQHGAARLILPFSERAVEKRPLKKGGFFGAVFAARFAHSTEAASHGVRLFRFEKRPTPQRGTAARAHWDQKGRKKDG
mmetsp:Transcript_23052/g.77821  ORF Transcript_23052/g.77821 Transcript_23052/m.77821 type:complete len:141 (-) Transcript_23052:98-520(-)